MNIYTQTLSIEKVLYHWRTEFQDVLIFENAIFGKVLVLDGVVQLTERDNHIYHEMIAHVPLMAHGSARNVLIIGGGDGGTLKEVLKHPVERATLVELDGEVIDLSRRYLPKVSDGAFCRPTSQRAGDGRNTLHRGNPGEVRRHHHRLDGSDRTWRAVVYGRLLQGLPNLPSSRRDDCGPEWSSVLPAEGTGECVRTAWRAPLPECGPTWHPSRPMPAACWRSSRPGSPAMHCVHPARSCGSGLVRCKVRPATTHQRCTGRRSPWLLRSCRPSGSTIRCRWSFLQTGT